MAKKKYKVPPAGLAERCLDIRCASKSGRQSTSEEHRFCADMFKKYPGWYASTEATVFNRTVPFGSEVHRKEEL